ncbi:MAG: dihydrofolate reductase [Patescibacteria group bacterium]|nr:dihydrofolate reductase [Patescibacteria group bacterium]
MKISIIAAMDEKRGIGKNGQIPWHISEDLQRVKKLTTGHTIVMGRKTFESIGHPLPNRKNIIVTHNLSYNSMGCEVAISLHDAIEFAKAAGETECFIFGGGDIFAQAIMFADELYLTIVKGDFGADTFFPDYSEFTHKIVDQDLEEGNYKFKFLILTR